ncbi:MAG: MBL fold metallo-hydrolase [Opitutales bacterium]|nr:MBL fold metallo-hydrolase [Opitutales bacterium]
MIGFEALICDPPYRTNVYYAVDRERKIACVIDAAPGSFKALRSKLNGLEVYVFLTHGHWDHVADAKAFKENLKAKLYLHRDDVPLVNNVPLQKMIAGGQPYEPFESDVLLNDGEMLKYGGWSFEVLHLPGHTFGSVGFYDKANNQLFVGDTLFYQTIGRTDLGGSEEKMKTSLTRLSQLPPSTCVYPGHGLSTTIESEKVTFERFGK